MHRYDTGANLVQGLSRSNRCRRHDPPERFQCGRPVSSEVSPLAPFAQLPDAAVEAIWAAERAGEKIFEIFRATYPANATRYTFKSRMRLIMRSMVLTLNPNIPAISACV